MKKNSKAVSLLKKAGKFLIWVFAILTLILIFIALLIQAPPVQTRLTRYAVSLLTDRTNTRTEFEKIRIAFPKSVVLTGFYLEDEKKDTLVYAGELKINIAFRALLRHKIHVRSVSLEDAKFNINRVPVDSSFNFEFLITAFSDTASQAKVKDTTKPAWDVTIDRVTLNRVRLFYDDAYTGIFASADLGNLRMKTIRIDLKDKLALTVNRADLEINSMIYRMAGKPEVIGAFDANNLEYNHIILAVRDINYSAEKTGVTVIDFQATDRNNFPITGFETEFSMDQHSITAKNLKAGTPNSSIDADVNIRYSSLNSLKDSLPWLVLNMDMREVDIGNSDILYFAPQLSEQPFFKDLTNRTTISGSIRGPINNLVGTDIAIGTGESTTLLTDFGIVGLPEIKTARFTFPDLEISSGRKDLKMMAGPAIPASIELPEKISLKINFEGLIQSFKTDINVLSSYGSADLTASIDERENFSGRAELKKFDLGRLMKNREMFGPVSMTAETEGKGFDLKTIRASLKAQVSEVFLNKYLYHDFNLEGNISGRQFEGKINLNDENAMFDFSGKVNLNPGYEQYKFVLNIQGADLKKLNLIKDDFTIALTASIDLKGGKYHQLNGNAGIRDIIMFHDGKKYLLDSLLLASINQPEKSELNVSSAIIGIKYAGTLSLDALPDAVAQFTNNYFPLTGAGPVNKAGKQSAFSFEIQLHNHPILAEAFLPQLKEFEPGLIQGKFDQAANQLILSAKMLKITYGTTSISDLSIDVNSDSAALNYKISAGMVTSSQIELDNALIEGKLSDGKMITHVSSIDSLQNKKLVLHAQLVKHDANYRLSLDPGEFYLMNNRWELSADNYVEFGKQGFLIHNFSLGKTNSLVTIASAHDQFNDDLSITIKDFNLDDISRIIKKDTSLVKGNVNGNVLLKRVDSTYGIVASAEISKLVVRAVPIGDFSLKATNPSSGKFDINVGLSGPDNQISADGFFIAGGGDNSINIKADIQSVSMKTLEALSMGNIREASGILSGNIAVGGRTDAPEITGEITFKNAFVNPAFTNNRVELKNETIYLQKDEIHFTDFTLLDKDQHSATLNGTIKMKQFKDFVFDLQVVSEDFLLLNTTARDNKDFFGKMIIDSRIDIGGPMALPVINARLKIKKGSNFTFTVPEDKLTTDRGEDVVVFTDTVTLNRILKRAADRQKKTTGFTGIDLSSVIEVDKQATLKLLLDPSSSDSLVVKGEAALSFALDRSGKMTLTGAYNLNDGSYLVSLESIIKRKFDIVPGSTIIWNGDPLDAKININATYAVRAIPYDLVADQMSGLSDIEKGGYKQRYPFLVFLKLRGEILTPVISFEIQLPPEEKGILGGAVNQKLIILNEDESALNKQVFALLVLGRFVQENPLQTESGGTSMLVRSTAGKFLSAQLNQLSSKVVPWVDLNFDIQSYDDYTSGQGVGRTQVEIGLKKQLFNERLSVELGGSVDVEGEKARQNSASDITSDITVEYKLTKDGRYRFKAFRHNLYEGAIEGQLVETGAGVLYLRDFNTWKEFFIRPKKTSSSTKKENSDGPVKLP